MMFVNTAKFFHHNNFENSKRTKQTTRPNKQNNRPDVMQTAGNEGNAPVLSPIVSRCDATDERESGASVARASDDGAVPTMPTPAQMATFMFRWDKQGSVKIVQFGFGFRFDAEGEY
jgi:hypothetical protein